MTTDTLLGFGPFRLDVADERLRRDGEVIRIGGKAFAVLRCLLERRGKLVTKDELLAFAWPNTAVTEAVLTTAMRELRRAIGEPAREPRYIETVHGRGYRFIAPVEITAAAGNEGSLSRGPGLAGREVEWDRIGAWHAAAADGDRRLGFIAGEAGIGKTALVDAFAASVAARGDALVARGQCVDHYGAGEPYLPLLEALGRLGRSAGGSEVAGILRAHAPSWLAHLPSLVGDAGRDGVAGRTPEVTSERMLRELAEALETLTARRSLLLVLEDLHWSDTATLAWISYVSRRRDPARLLILATYRPLDALLRRHPLRAVVGELRSRPPCDEIVLDYLSREAVRDYLRGRYGETASLGALPEVLHRRTGGHPLFLVATVEELTRSGSLEPQRRLEVVESLMPASARQFIEHGIDQLPAEDQALLEAASVAGDPFSLAAVAACGSLPEEAIEPRFAGWARENRFVAAAGADSWPDGTTTARFRFRHALVQEVTYGRLPESRRTRLHDRIGRRLEDGYGARADTMASELAMHFERAGHPALSASYRIRASRNALQRSAFVEARQHLASGLALIEEIPAGRDRDSRELELHLLLAQVLATTEGWANRDAEIHYDQARALCERLGDSRSLITVLWGQIAIALIRAELERTRELSRELLRLSRELRDPQYEIIAQLELGGASLHLGEPSVGREHFRQAELLYDPTHHPSQVRRFGIDHGVFARGWATHLLWYVGEPDRAVASSEETLALAKTLAHPFTHAIALAYAAMLHQFRLDLERCEELAEASNALSIEHGFPYYRAWAGILLGWCRVRRSRGRRGLAEIRDALAELRSKATVRLPYYRALFAESLAEAGEVGEALRHLEEGISEARETEERWWEPELHRLRGVLTLSRDRSEAEACLRRSIEIARRQQAKVLELRAATDLARSWSRTRRRAQAHRLLEPLCDGFSEGFATPDLAAARSLLAKPGRA